MRTIAIAALVSMLIATLAPAQTTYPTQAHPTQPQPTSPCTTTAPCPSPAASQPDTAAPPPTPTQPPSTSQPQSGTESMGAPGTPPQTGAQPTAPTPPAPPTTTEPTMQQRPASAVGPRTVPAGTTVNATLDTQLSTKTSRPGDTFTATVNQPVQGTSGDVVLPAGAKIHGEVAQAEQGKTLPAVRGRGQLNLRFNSISLPDGTTAPLQATLVSVHDTKSGTKTNEEGQISGGTSGGQAAKDVGIGAAAGTVAGLIFGSAVKGLAIGGLAGGGYILATGGKEVELPRDSGLRLRIDQNLALPATR